MKHAGQGALDALEPLLARLRTRGLLKERRRGVFYLRGRAFLHFHEDPAGLFADLMDGPTRRLPVTGDAEQELLLAAVDAALATAAR